MPTVRFYSDHVSATRLTFEWADEAFAVNAVTGRKLRALARKRGWSILDWRVERLTPDRHSQTSTAWIVDTDKATDQSAVDADILEIASDGVLQPPA